MTFISTILTIFVGITMVQLATAQSTTAPTKIYTSYRKIPVCNPADYIRYPKTLEEVVSIVQEAISRNVTVKAFGARHSETDIICTEGIPIETYGLKSYRLNDDGTATIGAGVTLHEATTFLRENGRAFKTTPAYGNITLGGAIGTGAHGSSIKYTSSISSQVVGMTIVNGLGNVINISTEEDLKAFRVHLGLLGIVVDITLVTSPLYKTLANNYLVGEEILTNGTVQQWAREVDQMSLYWFPAMKQVVVSNWSIVDVSTPGNAYTNDHVPSTTASFNLAVGLAMEQIQELATSKCTLASSTAYGLLGVLEKFMQSTLLRDTPDFVPIYTEDGLTVKMPAVGYYDLMFAPTCKETGPQSLQCIWAHGDVNSNITILDNEMSLALSDLPRFIDTVKDILTKAPASFPLQGILMRFSSNSTTYMSTSYGRDTVHFEFYMVNRQNQTKDAAASLAGYQTILQEATKTFGARSHWGKSGMVYQNSQMLDLKLDPTARTNFLAAMTRFDPNGIFLNNFGRRMKKTGQTLDSDPEATRCALMDYCFCSQNKDCGATQQCTQVPGYTHRVCKTIGETASILPYPLPVTNLVSWITTTLPGILTTTLASPLCSTVGSLGK